MKNSNYFVRVVRLIPFLLFLTGAAYAQSWSSLGSGTNNVIYAQTVYNNSLVVAGNFTTAGGSTANRVAVWNGTSWSTLGTGFNARVNALVVYNGNLIAGGNFTTAGGNTANEIAMWNGSTWSQVGTGINNGQVYALAVYSGQLIAAGTFTTVGGSTMNRIAKWNGTTWSILTNGVNNEVDALGIFNGNLIVGGRFSTTGVTNTNRIAVWNGTAWSAMAQGIDNGQVLALEVYNNTLIAGGNFTTIGGVSYNSIAKWNGTAWSGLTSGVNNNVLALKVYLGNLYAGGAFTTAGGSSANRIASWNGTTWSALGTGITGTGTAQVNSISVYNGLLTVAGTFNTAGGLAANNIAAWGIVLLAPALVSPVNNSIGQSLTPTLDWNDITGALTYEVQVSTDSLFGTTLVNQTGLTSSQYTIPSSVLSNFTKYYWRARGNNGTPGPWSAVWHFRTILAVPTLLLPVNNAIGVSLTPLLDWSDVAGTGNYRVQVSTNSSFTTTVIDQSTLTSSQYQVLVGILAQNTVYYWRARAYTGSDSSTWTGYFSFNTGSLGSPNLINPVNGATNQSLTPFLDWSDVSSATSYRIQVSADSLFGSPVFDTSGVGVSQLYVPSGKLLDNTLYYWRVNAANSFGTGGWSTIWHFSTLSLAPQPPSLVSPANHVIGQDLSLTLVWNRSAGAVFYRVQVSLDSAFTNIILDDSTVVDSLRAISGLNPLTYYWWRVSAKSSSLEVSAYSAVYTFKTIGSPFPVILAYPSNNSTNQPTSLTFQWNGALEQMAPNPIGIGGKKKFGTQSVGNYWFELVSDTVAFTNLVKDTTITDTLKTINGLNNLTKYYWRVKAKNQVGWGSFSAWFNMTTAPLPPAIVNLTVIPGGYYDPYSGQLNMSDTLLVVLVDSVTCLPMDSSRVIVDSVSFFANLSFSQAPTGRYYIYVFQRNHLTISSAYTMGVTRGSLVSYDFTADSSKTYGNNVIKLSNSPVRWGMIPGDANQDGYVDGLDQTIWLAQNGANGYFSADFNGDTYVDGLDQTIWMVYNGNSSSLPCYFSHVLRPVHVIIKRGGVNSNFNKVAPNVQKNLNK